MNKKAKARILLSLDWFAPGYKAGGPIRSCVNFAYAMRENYEVYVITGNKDFGEEQPYPEIQSDTWTHFDEGIHVWYSELEKIGLGFWKTELKQLKPDFVYVNNLFSKNFGLLPLLTMSSAPKQAKWILSPRGILRDSAIQYKSLKKKVYIRLLKLLRIQYKIDFLASDEQESLDIKKYFGKKTRVSMIGNFPYSHQEAWTSRKKEKGELKLIFFARISPIKNLAFIIDLLAHCTGNISMDIIGPIEDAEYWVKCKKIISALPVHIDIQYLGEAPHEEIMQKLISYHLFTMPTLGENFGHAIFEAILAGCPVLISDQTPWQNLEQKQVGWALALSEKESFIQAINQMVSMDQESWDQWSQATWNFGNDYLKNSQRKRDYEQLFA